MSAASRKIIIFRGVDFLNPPVKIKKYAPLEVRPMQ